MGPSSTVVHLPNGQHLTVAPCFGGYFFKPHDLNVHNSVFPAGWTLSISTEEVTTEKRVVHPFKDPTLRNDNMYISSISSPPSTQFKEAQSPTRQIAMMLWTSLYWYFHQKQPSLYMSTAESQNTVEEGKPRGEWRIYIRREGLLRGRNLIQKLERMGLIVSEDSAVGTSPEDNTLEGWSEMFVSRRGFWQLSAKLFLFTLAPAASSFPGSPYGSRPSSPVRGSERIEQKRDPSDTTLVSPGLWSPTAAPAGPFASGSHLPTYYPPAPLQYVMTSGVRHPLRPKPPRQGEIFYNRFIPSVGQYLSFRTASLSPRPVVYNGPTPLNSDIPHQSNTSTSSQTSDITGAVGSKLPPSFWSHGGDTLRMTDAELLEKWMSNARVSKFWGCAGNSQEQLTFLQSNMTKKNSFPAIGMWDGKPFGYFEIYWVKEDPIGTYLGERVGSFDRGFHVLVGEEEFRGPHRVKCWITSLAHWAFSQDYRTDAVMLEPRVDNRRFISTLNDAGFLKEGEISFPHKQSAFVKLRRENFESPEL